MQNEQFTVVAYVRKSWERLSCRPRWIYTSAATSALAKGSPGPSRPWTCNVWTLRGAASKELASMILGIALGEMGPVLWSLTFTSKTARFQICFFKKYYKTECCVELEFFSLSFAHTHTFFTLTLPPFSQPSSLCTLLSARSLSIYALCKRSPHQSWISLLP